MKKANFTTTPFRLLSQAALVVLMVCSVFSLQAQCGATYFDTGGANGPYNDTPVTPPSGDIVVCPDDGMTQYVRISFNQYDVAAGDKLQVFDGLMPGAPLLVETGEGSSVADSPGGGWVDASSCQSAGGADINSGCLTVRFLPNGDNVKGAGFTFTAECFSKGFSFPDAGSSQRFTQVISLGEFCEGTGVNLPVTPPAYSDCTGASLVVTADCDDAIVDLNLLTLPIGETTVTYTSPLFPSKKVTRTYLILPPTLACNDNVNVSLLNECTVAITPDLILEDPCEFADNLSGTAAYTTDYTVEFTDPAVVIVGTTLQGFPVADLSGLPCGTRLDVKVTRVIESDCSEDFVDVCWGHINIEDKVAPIIDREVDEYLIPCFVAGEDFLNVLNSAPQDGRALSFNLKPLRVTGPADMYNTDLDIASVSSAFGIFDNCFASFDVSEWQQVDFDCTTGGFDLHASADDPLWDLMVIEFGPAAIFRCYFRTVAAVDACGNSSNFAIQRVCVAQPDIVHPKIDISLPCGTDIDPIALYNFWAADPDWRKEYACFIPNYDPTPLDLNGDFGLFAGLDDTYFTDCSGDEVPAFPDHADCGYAIDWDDSEPITTCESSYKVFREWTVYNWCDGHLELIDVIPQVIKVGDTKDPDFRILGFNVGGAPYYDCAQDIDFNFSFSDDCSGNVRAYYQLFGEGVPLLPGFAEAEIDFSDGVISVPNFPIGEDITVIFRLIDDCGNSTDFDGFIFNIDDRIPPVAICETFRTVSMGIECEVIVPASSFDDGSYDNCGTVTFTVARMSDVGDFLFDENFDFFVDGDDPVFQPTITFTKEDLEASCEGTVTVVFRVQDGTGLDINGDGDYADN
ncbi:MAG: hypothetical protein AAF599_08505, partial [Bacteroidota bacterium]